MSKLKENGCIYIELPLRLALQLIFIYLLTYDRLAVARFLKKALEASHNSIPRVINVDKNPAYQPAVESAKEAGFLSEKTSAETSLSF